MSKTVTVNVTQEHIENAKGCPSPPDPITQALREGGYPNANTTLKTWLPDEDKEESYPLPDNARVFLGWWLKDVDLSPATFELPLE